MSKFKVGDKVVRNADKLDGFIFEKDRPYTVSDVSGEALDLDGVRKGGWYEKYFTLAEATETPKTTYTPGQFEEAVKAYELLSGGPFGRCTLADDDERSAIKAAFEVIGLYPEEPQRTLPAEDGVILWFPTSRKVGTYHAEASLPYWSVDAVDLCYFKPEHVTSEYGDDWVVLGIGDDFVNPEVTK